MTPVHIVKRGFRALLAGRPGGDDSTLQVEQQQRMPEGNPFALAEFRKGLGDRQVLGGRIYVTSGQLRRLARGSCAGGKAMPSR